MDHKVVTSPVLLALLLGACAIFPAQGSNCVTQTVTTTIEGDYGRSCFEPNCPQEFICLQGDCGATITRTLVTPSTWVGPVTHHQSVTAHDACYFASCAPAPTWTVSCSNNQVPTCLTDTVTTMEVGAHPFGDGPCVDSNCPTSFVCPNAGCTATITSTLRHPGTGSWPARATSACLYRSCLTGPDAPTETVYCSK